MLYLNNSNNAYLQVLCCIHFLPSDNSRNIHKEARSPPSFVGIAIRRPREIALSIGTSSNNLYTSQRMPSSALQEPTDLTLRTNNQTTTLLRALVDGLDDVDQLLLVLQYPIQLVIVTRSEIAHHVFIAVEKHDRHRIVELVHGVEIRDLVDVAQVDDGEVCGQ